MIHKDEAERIAREFVGELLPGDGEKAIVINTAGTIEKPYGWLFVFTTPAYLRTGDAADVLMGVGPLLVLRESGRTIDFASYHSRESALEAYEKQFIDEDG
ncbi:YrhB domain-containing protein [Nonomuraea sp. GTA35]|uniref:YrhB domain-containing protein n=1 Tax=Nonomuraea sp. GTA35 TaxID=1676746 RepID=UPI0035BF17F7